MTLDPDIAERIKQVVRHEGKTAQAEVNETLPAARSPGKSGLQEPFHVQPHDFGFIAGLDLDRMNHLADELELLAFTKSSS